MSHADTQNVKQEAKHPDFTSLIKAKKLSLRGLLMHAQPARIKLFGDIDSIAAIHDRLEDAGIETKPHALGKAAEIIVPAEALATVFPEERYQIGKAVIEAGTLTWKLKNKPGVVLSEGWWTAEFDKQLELFSATAMVRDDGARLLVQSALAAAGVESCIEDNFITAPAETFYAHFPAALQHLKPSGQSR